MMPSVKGVLRTYIKSISLTQFNMFPGILYSILMIIYIGIDYENVKPMSINKILFYKT